MKNNLVRHEKCCLWDTYQHLKSINAMSTLKSLQAALGKKYYKRTLKYSITGFITVINI